MNVISLNEGLPREIFHEDRTLQRAVEVKALPENWCAYFRERLAKATRKAM
jgi:YiiM-like, 3-alpha helix domain